MIGPLIALLALGLPASRPVPHGDNLTLLVYRSAPSMTGFSPGRTRDLLLATQVLEPVLAVDDGPALARVLEATPTRLVLEIEGGGHFGERRIEASDVLTRLQALARPNAAGAHTVLPIAGARARIDGDPSARLGITLDDTRLQVELAEPYPYAVLLLCMLASAGPESLKTKDATSGAFAFADETELRLLPDPHHRQGRPFAGALTIVRVQTPFGVRAEVRRRTTVALFGVPGQSGPDTARTQRLRPPGYPATEFVFLRAGLKSDLPIDILHSVGAALPRERLAEREWPGETLPAPSVRTDAEGVLSVQRRLSTSRAATLSYLEEEGPGRRLIERLQLDLLRLGVSARLEPLDLATFEARRRSRSFDLMVEPITLEGSIADPLVHEFHRLLALAAHYAVLHRVVAAGDLSRFAAAPPLERARLLEALEREILRAARIVPLVKRDLETRVAPELEGVRVRSFGLPELGGALSRPSETSP